MECCFIKSIFFVIDDIFLRCKEGYRFNYIYILYTYYIRFPRREGMKNKENAMWYVMQVRTGSEENVQLQCQKDISSEVLEDCFIPYYEEKRNIKGEWMTQRKILFPGYVFLDSQEVIRLYSNLQQVFGLTKLLKTGDEVVPLTAEEVHFLKDFGGEEKVVPVSEGIIENSKVVVMSGPLMGKEGYIKKIDRHKRRAFLEMPMFGRVQKIQVGLEIVAKV